MEAAIVLIRSQAGSDQVLDDPADYIRRARLCDHWARKNEREIFPAGPDPTLSSFLESYYIPTRLADGSKETIKAYRDTAKIWTLITGNPPVSEIDVPLLARFKGCLQKLAGMKRGSRMSVNTVASIYECFRFYWTSWGLPVSRTAMPPAFFRALSRGSSHREPRRKCRVSSSWNTSATCTAPPFA